MNSTQKSSYSLYIGSLPSSVSKSALTSYFQQFGACSLSIGGGKNNKGRGYAFLNTPDQACYLEILKRVHILGGRVVRIERALDHESVKIKIEEEEKRKVEVHGLELQKWNLPRFNKFAKIFGEVEKIYIGRKGSSLSKHPKVVSGSIVFKDSSSIICMINSQLPIYEGLVLKVSSEAYRFIRPYLISPIISHEARFRADRCSSDGLRNLLSNKEDQIVENPIHQIQYFKQRVSSRKQAKALKYTVDINANHYDLENLLFIREGPTRKQLRLLSGNHPILH